MKKEKTLFQLEKERKVEGIYMSPFGNVEEKTMEQIHEKLCDLFKMIKLVNEKGHNFCISFDEMSIGLSTYIHKPNEVNSSRFYSTITFHAPEKPKYNKEGNYKGPVGIRIKINEI
jgi:hypothetical protein